MLFQEIDIHILLGETGETVGKWNGVFSSQVEELSKLARIIVFNPLFALSFHCIGSLELLLKFFLALSGVLC